MSSTGGKFSFFGMQKSHGIRYSRQLALFSNGAVCQFHLKNDLFHRKMEFSQKKELKRYSMCITKTLKCLFRKFVGVKI